MSRDVDRIVSDFRSSGSRSGGGRGGGERRQRRERPDRGSFAGGAVAAAFGIVQAVTVTGPADLIPGQGGTYDQNWADTSLQQQETRRTGDIENGTLDHGYRTRWSGQR
jgi:hypothetical protein